jgi:hypothetical protein
MGDTIVMEIRIWPVESDSGCNGSGGKLGGIILGVAESSRFPVITLIFVKQNNS